MKNVILLSVITFLISAFANAQISYPLTNHPGIGSIYVGDDVGNADIVGIYNTFIGFNVGKATTSGKYNTFMGKYAGRYNTTGNYNTYLGTEAGYQNTTGTVNTFIGWASGKYNKTGRGNTFVGVSSFGNSSSGSNNVGVGIGTGNQNASGTHNVFLGFQAGYNSVGSRNIFIGSEAGYHETGSNKLYIDNSNTSLPLIHGDFTNDELSINGKMRVGTVAMPTGYQLYVQEGILTEKIKVASVGSTNWADYVFAKDYDLNSISEVEDFIQENQHLPNVPSAKEVEEKGVDMVEMDATLLRQIEELWLHMIEVKKENATLKTEIENLKK